MLVRICMKKIIACLLVCVSLSANAQFAALGYKMTDDYERFLNSTTYVVLTDNASYDTNIVHAVKKYWKITPYKFINYKKDLNKKLRDKKASFLLLVNMSTEEAEDLYNCLALVNGGKPALASYEFIDMLAYSPINHFLNEQVMYNCSYRVSNMVQSILQTLEVVQKEQIKGDLEKVRTQLVKYYRTKSGVVSKRILLVCPDMIGKDMDEEDFKKNYPFKTEFCKKETIEKMIATGDSSFYYLQVNTTALKSIFIIDPFSGEIVYADNSKGKFFSKDDLKDMAKTIEHLAKEENK